MKPEVKVKVKPEVKSEVKKLLSDSGVTIMTVEGALSQALTQHAVTENTRSTPTSGEAGDAKENLAETPEKERKRKRPGFMRGFLDSDDEFD